MRNRLVIKLGLASGRRIALQGLGESVERFQRRVLTKISKCQPHVIGMMKSILRYLVVFKLPDEFLIVHRKNSDPGKRTPR